MLPIFRRGKIKTVLRKIRKKLRTVPTRIPNRRVFFISIFIKFRVVIALAIVDSNDRFSNSFLLAESRACFIFWLTNVNRSDLQSEGKRRQSILISSLQR